MNRFKILSSGLIIALLLITFRALIKSPYDCGPDVGRNFQQDFVFMTTTGEYCGAQSVNCETRLPHWEKPINMAIYSERIEKTAVLEIAMRALADISSVTPIQFTIDAELEPNMIVFIMDEAMASRLSRPDARHVRFSAGSVHRMAYDDKSCSAFFSRLLSTNYV